jgi:hypothetical protein
MFQGPYSPWIEQIVSRCFRDSRIKQFIPRCSRNRPALFQDVPGTVLSLDRGNHTTMFQEPTSPWIESYQDVPGTTLYLDRGNHTKMFQGPPSPWIEQIAAKCSRDSRIN